MRIERLSFFVESVRVVPEGWLLEGEPGHQPQQWARPGDRFDRASGEHDRRERDVDLVVVECGESRAIVAGFGGERLEPGDILSGERPAEHDVVGASRDDNPGTDATVPLARLLGLAALESAAGSGSDWSSVEAELGVTLPTDYKRFADAYGAGLIDDHISVCAPGEPRDWVDLVQHNAWAHECVRLDFGGPGNLSEGWHLGDSSQWAPQRADVPSWFEPGDTLISWGHTGNGDLLFWHVKPGASPDDWPVVFKEEGPYWEQYRTGFSAALVGLLTGTIQSEYLSRWLGGPHSYSARNERSASPQALG